MWLKNYYWIIPRQRKSILKCTRKFRKTALENACDLGRRKVVKLLLTHSKAKKITIPKVDKIDRYSFKIQQLFMEYLPNPRSYVEY